METDLVPRRFCFEPLFLDLRNVKQIFLIMIARIKLLWKSYLVCSDVNEKYGIRQASITSVFKVFASQVIWESLVSVITYFNL